MDSLTQALEYLQQPMPGQGFFDWLEEGLAKQEAENTERWNVAKQPYRIELLAPLLFGPSQRVPPGVRAADPDRPCGSAGTDGINEGVAGPQGGGSDRVGIM